MDQERDRRPEMRLSPIDRPKGVIQRIVGWYFRMRFGKVMSALRVVYTRIPGFTLGQVLLARFAQKGLSLPPRVKHLVELRVSHRNGCSFCGDLEAGMLISEGYPEELLHEATLDVDDPRFDSAARAALRYVDSVVETKTVDDATFESLRHSFDERQIVEIVWLTAFTHYHNLMAKPLGLAADGFCEIARRRRGLSDGSRPRSRSA